MYYYHLRFTGVILATCVVFLATCCVEGLPVDNRARNNWLSDNEVVHEPPHTLNAQFAKESYHPPQYTPYGISSGSKSPNKTLGAILLFSVLGIGATVFFVIVCSKMAKKQKYDSMKGSVL